MVHIEGEIIIDRPVQEVFDFVADERNEPRYNPRMLHDEQLSSGPIGLGTRFRAEMTSMGRPAAMTIENTGYERPRLLASTTRLSTMDIEGVLLFDPVPARDPSRPRALRQGKQADALGLALWGRAAFEPLVSAGSLGSQVAACCLATRRAPVNSCDERKPPTRRLLGVLALSFLTRRFVRATLQPAL
jgi:hypothetical protein